MVRRATGVLNPYDIKDVQTRQALIAVKDALDRLEGASTDQNLKNVRIQDLIDLKVLKVDSNGKDYSAANPTVADIVPVTPSQLYISGRGTPVASLTWSIPLYEGHKLTEIYSSPTDNRNTATLIGTSADSGGNVRVINGVNDDIYFWVRFVNIYDRFGPFNAVSGTLWTGSQSPDIPISIIDDCGDLIVGQSDDNPVRLGVGSDGQVLTADSTAPQCLAWKDNSAIVQEILTVSTNGQTAFTLSNSYKTSGYIMMTVNSVDYDLNWVSAAGTALTYAFPQYPLKTKDTVSIAYETA